MAGRLQYSFAHCDQTIYRQSYTELATVVAPAQMRNRLATSFKITTPLPASAWMWHLAQVRTVNTVSLVIWRSLEGDCGVLRVLAHALPSNYSQKLVHECILKMDCHHRPAPTTPRDGKEEAFQNHGRTATIQSYHLFQASRATGSSAGHHGREV